MTIRHFGPQNRKKRSAPCPSCKARRHAIKHGEGYLHPGYVVAVICRRCGAAGHIVIPNEVAERFYHRAPNKHEWSGQAIIPRR